MFSAPRSHIPTPALVTQRAVQRLPRWALWMLCIAYVLPGVLGRDPWKNADITAYGYMSGLAHGTTSWLAPSMAGYSSEGSALPYWIGALFIELFQPWSGWIDPALAVRIPFALLLSATLALVWYTTLHLARTPAAQPIAFAFGGEANPIDYARAVADGALLALMACLGLLQLGHETTPELVQLTGVALLQYGMAACLYRPLSSRVAVVLSLAMLASSGAATMGLLMGALGTLVCRRSSYAASRRLVPWLIGACLLAALIATGLQAWYWRAHTLTSLSALATLPRLLAWFTWPVWPLVLWTLWHWRRQWMNRHLSVPLSTAVVACVACLVMGSSDRALMLGLPAMAILAAFALPTMQRSVSAALDWFSVFFFTGSALIIWVIYVAMHTGTPAQPAANVAKLAPGFQPHFNLLSLMLAALGTLAWLALVRWRTGRHQHALWKSLVLPAGGVALSWLLLMTLWLPLLNYARSYQPLVAQLAQHVPAQACVRASNFTRSQIAALQVHTEWTITREHTVTNCPWLLLHQAESRNLPESQRRTPHLDGWRWVTRVRRPTDVDEVILIYQQDAKVNPPVDTLPAALDRP